MIDFLLLNFPVIIFSAIAARLYFGSADKADSLLCAALFYFSYIILSEQALGLFNALTVNNLLLINLAVLSAAFLLMRFEDRNLKLTPSLGKFIASRRYDRFDIFFLAVILGFSAVKLSYNLVNPPFGWDSLNYHFTFAVEWLKHADLAVPLVISDNPCPAYYPLNGSLIYLWFIFPFKNVFLADLAQAPFFILVFLSIYNISRKLGVSKQFSFWAAALTTVTPNYFKHLSIAYVDVMVAAWFLVSLNFLLNLSEKLDLKGVVLFGLSLGMLVGTKTIALAYSFILAVPFFYFLFKQKPGRNFIYLALLFFICAVSTGGFSYLRNFIETGNPMYPLILKVWGKVIFGGVMDKANFTAFTSPEEYSLSTLLFHEGMGLGAVLFIIPGILLFFFGIFRARKVSVKEIILFTSFILLYLFYRYTFSLPNARYLYPALAMGYILSFYALHNIGFPVKILKWLVVVCFLASMPEMARRRELVASLALTAVLFFTLPYLIKSMPRLIIPSVIVVLLGLAILNSDYIKNEYPRYIKMERYSGFWPDATRAWEWLNNNTSGNNIAYIGRPVPFPLYGSSLKNNVYYVSVNRQDPAKLHYFPNSYYSWGHDFTSLHKSLEDLGNYRSQADYNTWLGNLLKRNTDYLFVYSLHQTEKAEFPLEDGWARNNPEVFQEVFANNTIHIYKIRGRL
jgi:hypothetical protein